MKTSRDTLAALFDTLTERLAERLKSGEATAADFNVARQLLKDNGIDAIPTKTNGLGQLAAASLPYQTTAEIAAEEDEAPFH